MNKYRKLRNPELLKERVENYLPFIYVGDTVTVSSRWAGDSKNSDEGKTGTVVSIKHNLESMFNRDYIDVTVLPESGWNGKFNTYLYALDLSKRKPENAESFRKRKIVYLDDRIEVIDSSHPKYGMTGKVVEVSGNGKINIVANDESVSAMLDVFEKSCAETIQKSAEQAMSDAKLLSDFQEKIKKNHPREYELFSEDDIKHAFESSVRQIIIKEVTNQPDYVKQINELNKELKFLAYRSSVKMVERFPPNALFKID